MVTVTVPGDGDGDGDGDDDDDDDDDNDDDDELMLFTTHVSQRATGTPHLPCTLAAGSEVASTELNSLPICMPGSTLGQHAMQAGQPI
jgi:hypothetical protein